MANEANQYGGHAFWLFGLSGAGKSTLAVALQSELLQLQVSKPLMLDGDRLRSGLSNGLGFSVEDRRENLRRAAEVTRLGVECGLVVISAFITPNDEHRTMIRHIIGDDRLSLIYLNVNVDVCRGRDPKGLYAGAAAGQVTKISGIDSPFDEPNYVDLRLDTGTVSIEDCVRSLKNFVSRRLNLEHRMRTERNTAIG